MTLQKLGKRIKKLRETRGLTQDDLASACETNSQYISSLERGQKNATVKMLEGVAKALKVELAVLFSFDSEDQQVSKQTLKNALEQLKGDDLRKAFRIISLLSE